MTSGERRVKWGAVIMMVIMAGMMAIGAGRVGAQTEPALLFVITGQSNAGQQGTAGELGALMRAPVGGAWYYAPQHTKTAAAVALQPYGGTFGVELSFARAVREATGREVVIAKVYRGGTSIIAWDPEPGTAQWKRNMQAVGHRPVMALAMYPKVLQTAADAAAAYGRPVELAGFVYIQVEKDSKEHPYASTRYEANLTELIAALRRDWNAPGLPVVLIDSHTNLTSGGPLVHDAVVAVAESVPGVAWVPVRDLPKKEPAHFSSAGVMMLGERLAGAWLGLWEAE